MTSQTEIDPTARVAAAENVHFRQFDDELLLLDLAAGYYFSLNAVGARMWHSLVAGKSPAEVATELAGDYEADVNALRRDCIALTAELLARGLLRRTS